MPWTPENLTNPEFIKTQLSPLDRSNALQTMTQNLTRVQSKLEENKSALNQVEDQTNGPYSFATVRAARSAATAAAAQGDPNVAALQVRYEELQAKRSELNAQSSKLLGAVQSGEEAIKTSQIGISNLEAAGAVPPGTNQFAAPPGYNSTINPPADVPASQNPVATPATTTPSVENPIPLSVNPNSDPNTNIGAEAQIITGFEPLTEPPITNDGDEFSGIDEQVQRHKDLEDGSLEFAGIDEQIAANEYALQEPPLLSDEEIDQQLRLAAQGDQIENEDPATVGDDGTTAGIDQVIAQQYVADDGTTIGIVEAGAVDAGFQAGDDGTTDGIIAAGAQGLPGATNAARAGATKQDAFNAKIQGDWRVRLSLADNASYLYNAPNPGILSYLKETNGVIFPYTPQIQITYAAHYDAAEVTHSNYKIYQYKNSSVDQVQITCDFTAQDTYEANYLLAVIHFFRSVTKMFYGNDQIPKPGTPPPLCYLSGLGGFQFDDHPLVINSFNYNLPNEVDYIRASSPTLMPGVNSTGYNSNTKNSTPTASDIRMATGETPLNQGAIASAPNFPNKATNTTPTYVPTKMQITISAYPIVTRNDISNNFSLREYATGKLLQGRKRTGGGIW
jgi:hypothetical protein